jgi:3-deoxy-D-manno-octulosonic acid kinase
MTSCIVPAGFVEQRSHKQTWWVKAGWEGGVQEALAQVAQSAFRIPHSAFPTGGGRGAVHRVALGERGTVIVRHYHRGGLVRHFVRDLYWDRPPRPLAELICTETARQRGAPTVEVLGAGVQWVTACLYRGTFVTREAEGAVTLWEWVQTRPAGTAREAVVVAVARAIARLHEVGVVHADLNLTNILIRVAADTPTALLLDFDRAWVLRGPLLRHWRERNLRRLRRSLDKLDPAGQFFSPTDLEIFCRAYHQGMGKSL